MEFKGAITAMITPFIDGKLDEKGLVKNIHHQIEAGISAILVLGSTGEAATLSMEERARVVEIAVCESTIPVMVGTGFNCTRTTIEFSKKAENLGANALVVVAPYYNKPTQEGIYRHFEAVRIEVSLPIMAYNVPSRTIVNIDPPTMKRIAALPNIIGVKESGTITQAMEIMKMIPGFTVLSGDDVMTVPLMSIGAQGVISVVSNLVPEKVVALVNFALSGDFASARKLHYELLALFNVAFCEVNPTPIKAAMNLLNLPAGGLRLPLCDISPENKKKVQQVLVEMELV